MGKIHELATVVINQIAAGEVIARPASAIKELVENAIDAGATRIRVEVDNDCRDLAGIDDGEGMSPEDAQLAVLRHATSKIRGIEDLNCVTTRGFRGEALASIAAVSRMEILTRRAEDVAGYRIAIEGGKTVSKGPVGCAPGTTVRVRDLFFNTPARRKFLKSATTEFNAVMQTLTRQMLARSEVGFSVTRGQRKIVDLPTDQPLAPRMVHLLGNLAESQLLKVNTDKHGVRVYGYVTRPEAARKDRREQHFFVNGRPISHRSMGYALGQAYHGLLMAGRYPVCCLFIDVPPEEIDVNVHPTKEEIRFREESKVTGVMNRAIVEALRAADLTPQLRLPEAERPFEAQARQLGFAVGPEPYPQAASGGGASARPEPVEGSRLDLPAPPPPRLKGQRVEYDFPWEKPRPASTPMMPPASGGAPDASGSIETPEAGSGPSSPLSPLGPLRPISTAVDTPDSAPLDPTPTAWPPLRGSGRVLGQVGDAYAIAAIGGDLLIVDQHAAHERVNYNRIMALFAQDSARGGGPVQPLLLPLTFDVPAGDVGRIEQFLPLLEQTGVELEHFGGQTYVVRSVPAALPDLDVAGLVQDLLADPEESGGLRNATLHERLAARMACHASVKANQRLSDDELRALLDELLAMPDPYSCPHGRPTMMRLTREQLDRHFKRK